MAKQLKETDPLGNYGLRSNSFHLDMYNDYVYRNV